MMQQINFLTLAQGKPAEIKAEKKRLSNLILTIKRDHGLVESNVDFVEFLKNWKDMGFTFDDEETRRGRLRWLLRRIHKAERDNLMVI